MTLTLASRGSHLTNLTYQLDDDATWMDAADCFLNALRGAGYILNGYNEDYVGAMIEVHESGKQDCGCGCDCCQEDD